MLYTIGFIISVCKMRDDEWALDVRGRLEFVQDLHAADALYHQQCSVNFRTLSTLDSFVTSLFAKAMYFGFVYDFLQF
jgi:hypothetical protein